jgi:hypothetical protein
MFVAVASTNVYASPSRTDFRGSLFRGQTVTVLAEAPPGWIKVDVGQMGSPTILYLCNGCEGQPFVLSESPPPAMQAAGERLPATGFRKNSTQVSRHHPNAFPGGRYR